MSEFFNAPPANPDEDTVYTMGALEGLPTPVATEAPMAPSKLNAEAPSFDLGQFIGSAAQLAELYPGIQNRPEYEPGLSDIRYTRSFQGLGEPGSSFYAPSGAGNAPAPFEEQIIYQQPILQPQAQGAVNEALLSGLFDMDWSGAYEDYLNKLRAQAQDINISNVFTPTNVNYQTQTQRQQQQQSMNGAGQSQEQDSDNDSQDDGFSLQDILDSIDLGDDTTDGVLDSDFFTDTRPGDNFNLDDFINEYIKDSESNDNINLDDFIDEYFKDTNNKDTYNRDDETIDFDIGRPETVDGGNGNDTIIGGDGNDTYVAPRPTDAQKQQVLDAYQKVFGRTNVDQEGLDYWAGQLAAGKSSTDLLRDLVSGAQGADVQAAQNTDTVSKLYQDLLGRAPDPEGLSYYRSQLAAGASPEDVARNIESGARGSDAAVVLDRQATSKFQDTVRDAITKRENIKNNIIQASLQGAPYEVLDQLVAAEQSIGKALQNYDVNRLLNDPNYARQQASQFGADALASAVDPNNPFSSEAVDNILSKAVNTFGANEIAKSLSGEAAKSILAAAGRNVAGDIAGDLAGPAAAALVSLAQGGSAGTAITEGAKAYAVATLAATPGVGQALAALTVADSFLSDLLGYESPVNEAVADAAKNVDKALEWVGERAIGSDPLGGVVDWVGDTFGDIGNWFSGLFAEGGLVDLPGDSMYNANTQGVLPDLMGFARGGVIPLPGGGKIARGPGGGLDDLIPTSIDGRRAAALSDGEFVIPADVVSMMGDGSTNAGSKRLYDMVRQVRQAKTGTSRQAGPLQVGKILERTMK